MYARTFIKPKLTEINKGKITKFYTELRKESMTSGGINIAVRHIESIIRMSEANARMHLREYVNNDDVDLAIGVMLQSFISSQKYSVARIITKKFNHYIRFREENHVLLKQILDRLMKEKIQFLNLARSRNDITDIKVGLQELATAASEVNISDLSEFLESETFTKNFGLRDTYIIKSI